MSLINDALKRAKQAQIQHVPVAAGEPAMVPVNHSGTTVVVNWALAAVGGISLLLACWFLFEWWRGPGPVAAPVIARAAVPAKAQPALSTASATPKPQPAKAVEAKSNASVVVPAAAKPVASNTVAALAAPVAVTTNLAKEIVPAAQPASPITVSSKPPAPDEPVQATLPDPQLTNLKLQGIFYRTSRASALINGQTLFLGDEIEGAKVVAIERQSVQMLLQGKVHVLRLR